MTERMAPMKLTEVAVTEVENYIDNPDWVMEQKMDGARALVTWDRGTNALRFNSWGGVPLKFAAAAQHFATLTEHLTETFRRSDVDRIALDGELMVGTGQFLVFDAPCVEAGWVDITTASTYRDRGRVARLITQQAPSADVVKQVHTAVTADQKARLWAAAQRAGVEGVVAKHGDSEYEPGGRSKMQRKLKFVKTADVIVIDWTRSEDRKKGSCSFGVHDDSGRLVPVGRCSLIGKPDVRNGDVIEVAYLYRDDRGGLIQPRMTRLRPDRPALSCTFDQFPPYSREAVTW